MKPATLALIYDAAADARLNPRARRDPAENVVPTVRAVAQALAAYRVVTIPIELPIHESIQALHRASPDAVFNLCEGLATRPEHEAHVAALLEILGYEYTGSGPAALDLCLDKLRAKKVLAAAGLRVPGDTRFPKIVKPVRDDGSHGITRASVIRKPVRLEEGFFAEDFIDGREFNVSILGTRVLPVSEIEFGFTPRVVTHAAKWLPGSPDDRGTVPVCPARIPAGLRRELEDAARTASAATGCRDYARVDIRYDGRVHALEVNPNPDLSPDAGFARAAAADGMSYRGLMEVIAGFALGRGRISGDRAWKRGSASSRKASTTSRR